VSRADAGDISGVRARDRGAQPEHVSSIGAELFALVAKARAAGVDPELELRAAARAFRDRFVEWERSSGK